MILFHPIFYQKKPLLFKLTNNSFSLKIDFYDNLLRVLNYTYELHDSWNTAFRSWGA